LGDASKIKQELSWEPHIHFDRLVEIMVEHDLRKVAQEFAVG
jgi:GDP-D-mannose dehydratase